MTHGAIITTYARAMAAAVHSSDCRQLNTCDVAMINPIENCIANQVNTTTVKLLIPTRYLPVVPARAYWKSSQGHAGKPDRCKIERSLGPRNTADSDENRKSHRCDSLI